MDIVKMECRVVFNKNEIGVGDIIEYNGNDSKWIPFKKNNIRVCGIVAEVERDCLWIYERDEYAENEVRKFGLPVERCDEIVIIRRHPKNL